MAAADGGPPPPGTRTASAATLAKPHRFWRDGKQISAASVVVVRLTVHSALDVLPKASPTPLFLLGHGVCELLKAPLQDTLAVFACPLPPADDKPLFWSVSFIEGPAAITAERADQGIDAALARGAKLLELPDAGSAKSYDDLISLRRDQAAVEHQQ